MLMATLATAWVNIVPSMKGAQQAITSQLAGVNLTPAATRMGSGLTDGLVKATGKGFATIGRLGLGALGAIGGGITALAAKGGFARALNIENAQAKLKGLGHSGREITQIMTDANAAVKGTAFGLDEAATVAASAVAAGITPGRQLENVLKTIGDTAQIAGMSFTDAGAIFTSVMARGKLQGDDMLQLTSRGVPVLQALSDQLGVSSQDVSAMVSAGKIDFQTFATAMDTYLGGAALAAGGTFTGALANVKAALSRLGQQAASPVLERLRDLFNLLTPAIDQVTAAAGPLADRLGGTLAGAFDRLTPLIEQFTTGLENGDITLGDVASRLGLLTGGLAAMAGAGSAAPVVLDLLSRASSSAQGTISRLTGGVKRLKPVVTGAFSLFDDLGSRWSKALGLVDVNLGGVFGLLSNRIRGGMSSMGMTLTGLFDSKIYVPLQQGLKGLGGKISAPLQALAGKAGTFLSPVTSAFATAFQGFGTRLATPVQNGLNSIGSLFLKFFNPANFLKYFGIAALVGALIAALGALNDSLVGQVQTLVTEFLTVRLPEYLEQFRQWVSEQLPGLMQSGLQLLMALLTGVSNNLPQILATATTILTTLVNGIAQALPTLIPAALEMILTLVQGIIDNLPQIIQSGLNLLAAFIQGIIEAIPQLIDALPKIITGFINGILDLLPEILITGGRLLIQFVQGIIDTIPDLIAALPKIISGFVNGIGKHLPEILTAGFTLLGELIAGIIKAIPDLIAALPQIITAIWDGLNNVNWGDLGRQVINGIKNGLLNAGNAIKDAIVGLAKNAWNAVKDFFGIHSPSRLMRDTVGLMVGRGLAEGILNTDATVTKAATGLAADAYQAFNTATAHGFTLDTTLQTTTPPHADTTSIPPAWTINDTSRTPSTLTKQDVVDAISQALHAMPAMRLLLDSGVMAGELAPAIDKALGNRKARGYA